MVSIQFWEISQQTFITCPILSKYSLLRSRSGRSHVTLPVPTRLLQTDIHSFLWNKPINVWLSFSCECSRLWLVQRIQWQAHRFEQTKAQNTEKGMYVGLKQLRGDGERYVTPARAAAKETTQSTDQDFSFKIEVSILGLWCGMAA